MMMGSTLLFQKAATTQQAMTIVCSNAAGQLMSLGGEHVPCTACMEHCRQCAENDEEDYHTGSHRTFYGGAADFTNFLSALSPLCGRMQKNGWSRGIKIMIFKRK